MIFRVEETCTWEDWDAWSNAYMLHGKLLGSASKALAGFERLWGALMAIFGGLLLLGGLIGGVFNLITVLGAAILLIGIRAFRKYRNVREAFSNVRRGRGLEKSISDKPMRFIFEEDGFSVWEPSGASSYRYHALTAVWEDKDRHYLFLQGKMQYVLRKAAFTQGTPDDFRAFISQKTGKPVEYIQ